MASHHQVIHEEVPALLDTTIDYICEQLFLSEHLRNALANQTGPYFSFLDVVISYEKRDKTACLAAAQKIGVNPDRLHLLYMEAINFSKKLLNKTDRKHKTIILEKDDELRYHVVADPAIFD